MPFTDNWAVVSGEVATAVKMNQLGENDDFLKVALGKVSPVGAITGYIGTTDPTGWLICNGRNVSRTTYADLFAMIGTAYGAGDGSTTFALPNIAGKMLVGFDSGQAEFNAMGKLGGAKTVTLSTAQMPHHSHGVHDPGHTHALHGSNDDVVTNEGRVEWSIGRDTRGGGTAAAGTNISLHGTGGGQAHQNMPPYFTQNWIIKT